LVAVGLRRRGLLLFFYVSIRETTDAPLETRAAKGRQSRFPGCYLLHRHYDVALIVTNRNRRASDEALARERRLPLLSLKAVSRVASSAQTACPGPLEFLHR
jgi:hypothetical protein